MDRIRLIAADLDETLLIDHSILPPRFAQTVRALAQQGILFAAASGRPLYTLEPMFADLADCMILIGDNGGAAQRQGKPLFVSEMPAEDWRALARLTKRAGDVGVLCGLDRAYVERRGEEADAEMRHFYTKVEYVDDLEQVQAPADKFTVYFPRCNAKQAFDEVYAPACAGKFSAAVAGLKWVDMMNPGVHKGAALAKLGEILGIDTASMMAFGDTYNDAEMLQTARYGFLMANGSEPLRAKVPFLAPSNREYGVMQVVERVLAHGGTVCPEDFTRAHE